MTDWTCPHGYGMRMKRGDCAACNTEIDERPAADSMDGDARYAEVIALLNEPSAFRVEDIHGRLEALVGRSVWTHEFAQDLALAEEARTWSHPADINAHALSSLKALADGKPVHVVNADDLR